MGSFTTLLVVSILFSTIFYIAFLVWKKIWFNRFGVEIPIDKNFNIQEINQRKLFYKTKTFKVFTNFFFKIISKLEPDYWITHCGTDGYLYLLFQRRFLKLSLYFSIISLCVSIPINIFNTQTYHDWFERTTLNNKELTELRSWVHVALVLIFTLLTIRTVQKTRKDARFAYQYQQKQMSKSKDHEWLKARTIHVKGVSPEDRSGNALKSVLERALKDTDGQVLAVLLIPDFVKQLSLEGKIQDLKELQVLLSAQDPSGRSYSNICIPKKFTRPQQFEAEMDKLENQLNEETLKPFKPSGHAFVCFDSIKSVNVVLQKYKMSPWDYIKLLCFQLKDKIRYCINAPPSRNRNQSTFIKFEDLDYQVAKYGTDYQVLMLNLASEPIDLLWKNLGGTRGLFLFRRIILYLLGIFVILFLTTPTAMLSSLQYFDFLGITDFEWIEKLPFGPFLKTHLPPLIVLGINQILLLLIDVASLIERYECHSLYQKAVYTRTVIYLNLNMLIIPALTLTNSEPLIKIFSKRQFDITQVLGDFYIANSGIFFVSILLQQACLSSAFYLLNLSDIFFAYFSPWLALEKRKIFNDSAPWRRKENMCFQYGYFYAQMMTAFAISLIFSSTIPLVTLAAFVFLGLRHVVDCFQLLTYFRKEIDSSGKLISTVTNSALLLTIMYQLCMMGFFTIKNRPNEAIAVTLILVFCVMYTVISYEEVYDLSQIDEEASGERVFNNEAFEKWKAEYEHPLVIGNVQRKAKALGVEVKTVNDWQQFLEDKDVQGILSSPNYRYRKSGFFQDSEEIKEDANQGKKE